MADYIYEDLKAVK